MLMIANGNDYLNGSKQKACKILITCQTFQTYRNFEDFETYKLTIKTHETWNQIRSYDIDSRLFEVSLLLVE